MESSIRQFLLIIIFIFLILGICILLLGVIDAKKIITRIQTGNFVETTFSPSIATTSSSSQQRELKIIRAPMPQPITSTLASISPKSPEKSSVSIQESIKSAIPHSSPSSQPTVPSVSTSAQEKTAVKSTQIDGIADFTYDQGLQSIVDRYNTEKVKKAFKTWYHTLMIRFPDIDKAFLFKISGAEGLEFSEGVDEESAVQVTMDSMVFVKMMTKQINPIKAYSSGSLEVKGEMKNMLKLRKLMF